MGIFVELFAFWIKVNIEANQKNVQLNYIFTNF